MLHCFTVCRQTNFQLFCLFFIGQLVGFNSDPDEQLYISGFCDQRATGLNPPDQLGWIWVESEKKLLCMQPLTLLLSKALTNQLLSRVDLITVRSARS